MFNSRNSIDWSFQSMTLFLTPCLFQTLVFLISNLWFGSESSFSHWFSVSLIFHLLPYFIIVLYWEICFSEASFIVNEVCAYCAHKMFVASSHCKHNDSWFRILLMKFCETHVFWWSFDSSLFCYLDKAAISSFSLAVYNCAYGSDRVGLYYFDIWCFLVLIAYCVQFGDGAICSDPTLHWDCIGLVLTCCCWLLQCYFCTTSHCGLLDVNWYLAFLQLSREVLLLSI